MLDSVCAGVVVVVGQRVQMPPALIPAFFITLSLQYTVIGRNYARSDVVTRRHAFESGPRKCL
jgi:hypothetical protein